MSWNRTYSHNVLYGIDCLGAVLFWNQPDVTISSLCRVVQLYDFAPALVPQLPALKFWRWQIAVLRFLAPILDKLEAGHCELARKADLARAERTKALLTFDL